MEFSGLACWHVEWQYSFVDFIPTYIETLALKSSPVNSLRYAVMDRDMNSPPVGDFRKSQVQFHYDIIPVIIYHRDDRKLVLFALNSYPLVEI